MSWVEIAFIAVFIGFSLLGRRRGGAKPGLPPVGAQGAEDARPPRPEVRSLGSMLAAWEEALAAQQAATLPPIAPSPELALPVRLPALVAAPLPASLPAVAKTPKSVVPRTVSLEMTEVDRDAEHDRFHERYIQPLPAQPGRERGSAKLRLRGAGELRRAVLLAEVLGAPRSMQPLEARTL